MVTPGCTISLSALCDRALHYPISLRGVQKVMPNCLPSTVASGMSPRAAGLHHVLNIRLNIGEFPGLDAITQLVVQGKATFKSTDTFSEMRRTGADRHLDSWSSYITRPRIGAAGRDPVEMRVVARLRNHHAPCGSAGFRRISCISIN